MNHLCQIPPEILLHIADYLHAHDTAALSCTCTRMHQLLSLALEQKCTVLRDWQLKHPCHLICGFCSDWMHKETGTSKAFPWLAALDTSGDPHYYLGRGYTRRRIVALQTMARSFIGQERCFTPFCPSTTRVNRCWDVEISTPISVWNAIVYQEEEQKDLLERVLDIARRLISGMDDDRRVYIIYTTEVEYGHLPYVM